MAADEDLARVSTHPADIAHRPGKGRGGIVDVLGVFRLWAESVIGHDYRDTFACKACRDFGAMLGGESFAAFL